MISLYAMKGLTEKSYQTMRVVGNYKKKLIHLLIDSSSTNDFLNLTMAKGLGCQLQAIDPVNITLVNGQEVKSWKIKNMENRVVIMSCEDFGKPRAQ